MRPVRQIAHEMRPFQFGIAFYFVFFLGTILLAAARGTVFVPALRVHLKS